jgi:hypothetical protein
MRDDFVKKGVTLRYSYFDKDKQPINHAIANSESTIFAASRGRVDRML